MLDVAAQVMPLWSSLSPSLCLCLSLSLSLSLSLCVFLSLPCAYMLHLVMESHYETIDSSGAAQVWLVFCRFRKERR